MSARVAVILTVTGGIVLMVVGVGAYAIVRFHQEAQDAARDVYERDVRSWSEKLSDCGRNKLQARLSRQGWAVAARVQAALRPAGRPSRAYVLIMTGSTPLIEALDCLDAYPEPPPPPGIDRDESADDTRRRAIKADEAGEALELRIRRVSLGTALP